MRYVHQRRLNLALILFQPITLAVLRGSGSDTTMVVLFVGMQLSRFDGSFLN